MSRRLQILRFLTLFGIIWGTIHFYLFLRIAFYLELDADARFYLGWTLGILAFASLMILPVSRTLPRSVASLFAWTAYTWMGMGFVIFTGLLVTDVGWGLLSWVNADIANQRTALLAQGFGTLLVLLIVGTGLYALFNALRPVKVRHVDIKQAKLPLSFQGLRIAQISDVHIGSILGGKWLTKVVNQINALDVHLVVITGDLVDGSVKELASHIESLRQLKARYGVYFVTGNHEYYSGVVEWCRYLESLKIKVLRNETITLVRGNDRLEIAGVNDWSTRHYPGGYHLERAIAGHDPCNTLILLSHQPASMHDAISAGVDLQLSGHTHGGQIWPFNYLVYLQQPVVEGLYKHPTRNFQMYVSPGTGFWGPPMRLATRAEITHLTLSK